MFFAQLGRPTYHIVKLEISGRKFVGNANLCFQGTPNQERNLELAERYWQVSPAPSEERPVWEILVDGKVRVAEIVEEIGKNLEAGYR